MSEAAKTGQANVAVGAGPIAWMAVTSHKNVFTDAPDIAEAWERDGWTVWPLYAEPKERPAFGDQARREA